MSIKMRSVMFADTQIGSHRSFYNRLMREIVATAYEAGAREQMRILGESADAPYVQWDPESGSWLEGSYK